MINATYRNNWQSNLRQSNARFFTRKTFIALCTFKLFVFLQDVSRHLLWYFFIDFSAVRFPDFTLANLSIQARKYKQRPNNVYCKEKLNVLDEYSTIK